VKVTDTIRDMSFVTGRSDPGKNLAELADHARGITRKINLSLKPNLVPSVGHSSRGSPLVVYSVLGAFVLFALAYRVIFTRKRA